MRSMLRMLSLFPEHSKFSAGYQKCVFEIIEICTDSSEESVEKNGNYLKTMTLLFTNCAFLKCVNETNGGFFCSVVRLIRLIQ